MKQTRGKWDSLVLNRGDFWMIWRCRGIPCFHLLFCFRNNGKREQLNENNFRRCYGNFFPKASFRKYLIAAVFKVLFQQWRGTLTTVFEKYLTIEYFTDIDHHNIGVDPAPRYLTYYCMFLLLSNKLSFKLVLME